MGLRTETAATPNEVTTPPVAKPVATTKPAAARPEVKGQVAMHAIITGYEVASRLAATLAGTPEKVRETLHSMAAEVAAKIEAYTFRD